MIIDLSRIIRDGLILSAIVSPMIAISLYLNPRIWLQDYPSDIQAQVAPKTEKEKRWSLVVGIPFLILLIAVPLLSTLALENRHPGHISFLSLAVHAFGVIAIFNLVDWVVLDWLIFCTFTPKFVVIPGSEGMAGYKDYWFHFRGFLIGTVYSAVGGLVIGGIVSLVAAG
jgi:hypothetical protein